jgi:hypothetical protein
MKKIVFSLVCLLGMGLCHTAGFAQEQLLKYPDQWQFEKRALGIILTSDQQLIDLQDPDKQIELTTRTDPRWGSLRMICDTAKARGAHTVKIAFDNFFRQYREESSPERNLTPDDDQFIAYVKNISDFMADYGLGIELSLLSPLEIGKAYRKSTGESGRWVQFITDMRDPETGDFSTTCWEQLAWSNNKGKVRPVRTGIRAFAYKSETNRQTGYRVVRPEDIREITAEINVETFPGTKFPETQSYEAQLMRIHAEGKGEWKGYNRVFVLISYDVPEMDYFSPDALPFLKNLMKKYFDAGIRLTGLYSDEMHIQQGWAYHEHHDRGQFTVRYLTDNFAKKYAESYGLEYGDMDKMMLYFVYGPEVYSHQVTAARKNVQIVMGDTPEDVQRTFLMRDRYYKMLNGQVVDLFLSAKRYAESLYGWELLTRAHATWAQSPTIDFWDVGRIPNDRRYKYEYTPDFVWSNTVHQAASACYDYWKWGEYLTAMGTDHTEGGWSDRNYYAGALASGFGLTNKYPNAYNGLWGMPDEVRERLVAVYSAYGAANAFPTMAQITERVHRDVEVLMLYPMNLVASEERFGSWMTQYGYCNYLTTEKLVELGELTGEGKLRIKGRDFSTLVALFEPFPDPELLDMMEEMAAKGNRIIWSGPPPLIYNNGQSCLQRWEDLFGVDYEPLVYQGLMAPGRKVSFENNFSHIPDQLILGDFLVDHVYPVTPRAGSEVVARVNDHVVGTHRNTGKGTCTFLGFRPRDDQSESLGYEQRTWFEILDALGAYPATGTFSDANDNTEHLSRTTDYLCTRFPNRTTAIVRHYRTHPESWHGGFGRVRENDIQYLEENPLPPSGIEMDRFKVNGHVVSYEGDLLMAFRLDEEGDLLAFDGRGSREITIDGKTTVFADQDVRHVAWTPVAARRQVPGGAFFQIYLEGEGEVSIPLKTDRKNLKMYDESHVQGLRGGEIPFGYRKEILTIKLDGRTTGKWLYLTGE